MFNVGPSEIIVILVLALLVFGPKRLPEIGKTVGKTLRDFRKTQEDIKREIRGHLSDNGNGTAGATRPVADKKPEGAGSPENEGSSES